MTIEWRLHKIYSPEEQEERASKALELNGITPLEGIGQTLNSPLQEKNSLKAASKTKPTVRVNKLKPTKKESLVDQLLRQQQAKLKAAANRNNATIIVPSPSSSSPISSVQVAAALPTHDVTPDMVERIADNQTELIAKTTCLGCGLLL